MRPLTNQEKRTIRVGTVLIGIYLLFFCGLQMWKSLEKRRVEYQQLVSDAQNLRLQIQSYQDKAEVVKKLMEDFHLDPARLTNETVVAQASSAIQKAASSSGIQVGAIHETASRPSADAVASMQFEGSGPVPAITGLLSRMQTLGFPVIIESVQLSPDNRPGNLKVSLTITILDFKNWKNAEASHA
jgi:hypothetical protein